MGIVLPLAALALLIASVWGVVGPLPEGRGTRRPDPREEDHPTLPAPEEGKQ